MLKSIKWLVLANVILLGVSWAMSIVAYPRLPSEIPVHFNLSGLPDTWSEKSRFLFFIPPVIQAIFFIGFFILARVSHLVYFPQKDKISTLPSEKKRIIFDIIKEFIFLVLIFFNLIFIHFQRSVILTAHQLTPGMDIFYFYSIFGIIFLLVLLYFLRIKFKVRELLNF